MQVHERTHRNDRPFQCNICHQKFYRKEPMQKHQWRQHGIVHFKSRPNNCANGNSGGNSNNPQVLGIIGAEGVLYSSLIDRLKEDGSSPDSDLAASTSLLFDSESSRSQLTEHEEVYDADLGLAAGHRGGLPHDKESPTDDFQTLGACRVSAEVGVSRGCAS